MCCQSSENILYDAIVYKALILHVIQIEQAYYPSAGAEAGADGLVFGVLKQRNCKAVARRLATRLLYSQQPEERYQSNIRFLQLIQLALQLI